MLNTCVQTLRNSEQEALTERGQNSTRNSCLSHRGLKGANHRSSIKQLGGRNEFTSLYLIIRGSARFSEKITPSPRVQVTKIHSSHRAQSRRKVGFSFGFCYYACLGILFQLTYSPVRMLSFLSMLLIPSLIFWVFLQYPIHLGFSFVFCAL